MATMSRVSGHYCLVDKEHVRAMERALRLLELVDEMEAVDMLREVIDDWKRIEQRQQDGPSDVEIYGAGVQ